MVTKVQKRTMVRRGLISLALIGVDSLLRLLKKAGTMEEPVIERTTKGEVSPKGDEIPTQLAFKNIPLPQLETSYKLPPTYTNQYKGLREAANYTTFRTRQLSREAQMTIPVLVRKGLVVVMRRGETKRIGNLYAVPNAVKALL